MIDFITSRTNIQKMPPHAMRHAYDANGGRAAHTEDRQTRAVAVTSGKGGVGKTNIAVNVALELASLGRRVSLLDADLALANTDVLLGLNPRFHLGHVLSGARTLSEVVVDAGRGVRLLPGGSGIEELASLTRDEQSRLISELRAMEQDSDFIIIDTPAGIAANVTGVLRAATEVIIVVTPEPTSVVDAYATLKVLHQHSPDKPVHVVVNGALALRDADEVFGTLSEAAWRFLGHRVELLGVIPRDTRLAEAVREKIPVVEFAPETPASRSIRLIAKHLDHQRCAQASADAVVSSFWCALTQEH